MTAIQDPGIFTILKNSAAAAKTARTALSVAQRNVSRANDADASVEIISIGDSGVQAPIRIKNETFVKKSWDISSTRGALDARQRYFNSTSLLIGTTDDNNSLNNSFLDMERAISTLQADPASNTQRSNALLAIQKVTTNFQTIAAHIQDQRQVASSEINAQIATLNSRLDTLANLNLRIVEARQNGLGTVLMEDERDTVIRNIASVVDISTTMNSVGSIDISLTSGPQIVNHNTVVYLEYNSPNVIYVNNQYIPDKGDIPPILLNGQDITNEIAGGTLQGLISLRDKHYPQLQAEFDQIAQQFLTKMNAIHNEGCPPGGFTNLTATQSMNPTTNLSLSGMLRLCVVDDHGKTIAYGGPPPQTPAKLDLSSITGLSVNGPTLLEFAQAINDFYDVQIGPGKIVAGVNNGIFTISNRTGHNIAIGKIDGATPPTIDGKGFSSFFGFNDLLVSSPINGKGYANSILLRNDIAQDAGLFCTGRLDTSAPYPDGSFANGWPALPNGGIEIAQDMYQCLNKEPIDFALAGQISARKCKFTDYAQSIIEVTVNIVNYTNEQSKEQKAIFDTYQEQIQKESGIDIIVAMQDAKDYQMFHSANLAFIRIADKFLTDVEDLLRR